MRAALVFLRVSCVLLAWAVLESGSLQRVAAEDSNTSATSSSAAAGHAQDTQLASAIVRAHDASMRVLHALTDARMTHRTRAERCLDEQLTQLNSIARALDSAPASQASVLDRRVSTLVQQAVACDSSVGANGKTVVQLVITPPVPPDSEPRNLDQRWR